jgi:transitional endoplasmic reticulum ATPase
VISQILTEMDGLEELHNVTVIAATNRMDLVDPALLRPGRFDRHIYISPPDLATRRAILKIHTKKKPLSKDVDLEEIAKRTDKYTGAELAAVCNEASMLAIREFALKFPKLDESSLKKVSIEKRHFEAAMKRIQPQTGDASLYTRMPSRFPPSPEVG